MNSVTLHRTLVFVLSGAGLFMSLLLAGCAAGHYEGLTDRGPQTAGPQSPGLLPSAPSSDRALPWVQRPGSNEEIWVITKPLASTGESGALPPGDDTPGCGAMLARMPDAHQQVRQVPIPLQHTQVQAGIAGYLATVDVTQRFHNPYDAKIEAVYVFPLPENAAIHEFVMTIGDRKIRGLIRERAEAEKIYAQARSRGLVASLLTQERPNLFTQKVANIEPGKAIDVSIRYYHALRYDDGWYEFVFPMVVGPRYNPAGSSDGVGAVARGAQGVSGQKTEVQYLRPTERSGHDIDLAVDLQPGVAVEEIVCRSHRVRSTVSAMRDQADVVLMPDDRIPNKDFVLRYRVAGAKVKSGLVLHHDDRGGFFTLMVFPPRDLQALPREPMELVFLLDCSGSMNGQPLERVKQAVTAALRGMDGRDTFQVITFADHPEVMTPGPIPATPENRRLGLAYVAGLRSEGGTEMLSGMRAAIQRGADPHRRRLVALFTDGFIGNENQVIAEVAQARGDIRFFAFGVGSAPNRYLIDGVAKAGAGAAAYVGLNDDPSQATAQYLERISHPALTDLAIDYGGMQVFEVYPNRVADLYLGRPIIVTGRCQGRPSRPITVTGRAGGQVLSFPVAAVDDLPAHAPAGGAWRLDATQALPPLWARLKIAELCDQIASTGDQGGELLEQVKAAAIEYGLLSDFTAFVAVDASRRTQGHTGTTVNVPVPVPEGTRYDTTVQEK
jgi:Ca-activated chloride channel family protein